MVGFSPSKVFLSVTKIRKLQSSLSKGGKIHELKEIFLTSTEKNCKKVSLRAGNFSKIEENFPK